MDAAGCRSRPLTTITRLASSFVISRPPPVYNPGSFATPCGIFSTL